jgi:glc operon protein GlcG
MRVRYLSFLLFAAAGAASGARAAPLDARQAQAIVAGCASHAASRHQSHAIAVVDAGGHLVAALRMDGNGSGIMDFAIAKAEASAAWGFATAQMAEGARATPGFAAAPHVVTVPGGLPVWSADGRERLGAVGVSGEAPADDAACAEAGIVAAGLRSALAGR